jgi:hypothetical protein
MSEMPSPILIFGDAYTSKNNLIAARKKYSGLKWVTKSASTDTLNNIRMEAGFASWDDSEKVLLIQDLPNKKNVRDFLVNLASSCPLKTKLIVWDSLCHIKIDPKEKTIEKSWSDFVSSFRGIKGSKVINNGESLTEKTSEGSVEYVISCFEKYKKQIGNKEARLLINIVGFERGMLDSDIKKMSLTCPEKVTSQFILDNAFPTTKEALLYKIGNILDDGSLEDAINLVDRFLASGFNANEIAVIIAKKARWQMIVAQLWCSGLGWESIPNQLMEMGRFPSSIWHNDQMEGSRKRQEAEALQIPENMVKYLNIKEGLPLRYFKPSIDKATPKGKTALTRKNAEVIPMYFMAEQTVNFVKNRIVRASKLQPNEIKEKLLNRSIKTYLFMQEKLAEIRYGENPEQDLQEMIKGIMSVGLENY